jgi:hypothetical protein
VPELERESGLLSEKPNSSAFGQTLTTSAVVAPGLISSIASSSSARQRLYASTWDREALPTAKHR